MGYSRFQLRLGPRRACLSGFSDSAGVRDTSLVIAVIDASGAPVHEVCCTIVQEARPVEGRSLSGSRQARGVGMMVLVCYDGSADAQAAIVRAGELMPGSDAVVLVIWETVVETMNREGSLGVGLGMVATYSDENTDAAVKQAAVDRAAEGTERAVTADLVAQPRIVNREEDIARAILATAADIEADLIVLGTRGLGAVKSLMLGSVTHAVLHHADRPVLVIPSPALAGRRRQATEAGQASVGAT